MGNWSRGNTFFSTGMARRALSDCSWHINTKSFLSCCLRCTWRGKSCDIETEFKTIYTDLGVCYTFNGQAPARQTKEPGEKEQKNTSAEQLSNKSHNPKTSSFLESVLQRKVPEVHGSDSKRRGTFGVRSQGSKGLWSDQHLGSTQNYSISEKYLQVPAVDWVWYLMWSSMNTWEVHKMMLASR